MSCSSAAGDRLDVQLWYVYAPPGTRAAGILLTMQQRGMRYERVSARAMIACNKALIHRRLVAD